MTTTPTGPTLTAVLHGLGYTHHPRTNFNRQGREVRDSTGSVVIEGPAHEVWAWLRESGQYTGRL